MEEILITEIKQIQINLLKNVDKICENNNFRYSLGGGTLLGAIRHKGYIPWDDDIDLMMPRPDYEKFLSFCENNEVPFGLLSFENDKSFVDLSCKIYDKNSYIIDDTTNITRGIGVNIDIFPIDGLGNTYEEAKNNFNHTKLNRELLNASNWKKYFLSKTHSLCYEPLRFSLYLISRFINKAKKFNRVNNFYKKIDFNNCKFAGAVGGSYRIKEILPIEVFTSFISVEFEGSSYKAIAGYNKYLSSLYGNYFELPPKEKRVTHHTFKAFKK